MRWLAVSPALALAACAAPEPARPVTQAPAAAPVATAQPAAEPLADEGPPPEPPMAVRWTFHLPPFDGHAWTTQRLVVAETGDATWESERGEGDGEVDETLSPTRTAAPPPVACRAHVGPRLHRRVVEAARKAMASGCQRGAPRVDAATTSLAVTWEGEIKSCLLAGSGGSYAAFEQLRSLVVAAACQPR